MALLSLWIGTYAYCVVSGLVPFVNAEAYLLGAAALAPTHFVLPVLVAGTLGQMTAKVMMYGAGRGALRLPGERMQRWIQEAEARYRSKQQIGTGVLFLSAASGIPPFYVVSVASGVLRVPFWEFVILGTIGRFIRFGLVVLVPYLIRR